MIFKKITIILLLMLCCSGCGELVGANRNLEFQQDDRLTITDPLKMEQHKTNQIKTIAIVNVYDLLKEAQKLSQGSLRIAKFEYQILYEELKKSKRFEKIITPFEFSKNYLNLEDVESVGAMENEEFFLSIGRVGKTMGCDAVVFMGSEQTEKMNMYGQLASYMFVGVVNVSYTHTLKLIGGKYNTGEVLYEQGQIVTMTSNGLIDVNTPNDKLKETIYPTVTSLSNDMVRYLVTHDNSRPIDDMREAGSGANDNDVMDKNDWQQLSNAFESGRSGQPVIWQNPNNSNSYKVIPQRAYYPQSSHPETPCRQANIMITIGDKTVTTNKTACRNNSGIWTEN